MSDPASEIRHLLGRYQEAMSARDLATLSDLHWQDPRFTHAGPAGLDVGWGAYAQRLSEEFLAAGEVDFLLADVRVEVFHGKFGSVLASWERQGSSWPSGGRAAGVASFFLSKMGSSWKIVADHHAPARVGTR
jgi:ketosteroid isomerase-like protein